MLKSFLQHAWRNLVKDKTYSVLNIAGLSVGITCFAFIALWVVHEVSYDKFNSNYDRIVRLTAIAKTETGIVESAVSSAPMAKALRENYPEVENTVRLDMHEEIITHNGQQILQDGILLADPSFFDIFSYSLSQGDVSSALNDPYSIILTQSTAKKYFGDGNPMGQTLTLNMLDGAAGQGAVYKITGVMPDPPKNAHFTFNILASFKTVEVANPDVLTVDGWGDASFYTYLLLKKGVDPKVFSRKITQFYEKYIGDRFAVWRSIYFYKVQPLRDIYLRSKLQYEIAATGDIKQVYIFSTIGIFILLLAGINYMNLATARSVNRAKEVGIKKVVGALKRQLVIQYLAESVFTALLALAIAILFSFLLQPLFFELTEKDIDLFSSPTLIFLLITVTVFLGIASGLYPALIFSTFKPIQVLKGAFKSGSKGIVLRRSLVVSQFIITLILIIGIIVIHTQMSYIKSKDLGYDKESLIYLRVHGNNEVVKGYESFKNELLASPVISGVTTSNSLPVGGFGIGGSETVDINNNPLQVNTSRLRVDADYLNVYGIKLLAGKNFSPNAANDTVRPILLNEEAVKKFAWKDVESAIGKPFKMGTTNGTVIGVVKNFHFNSLQKAIEPLAIYPIAGRFSTITVKADVSQASKVIALIENKWKKHFAYALLDYNFLDKSIVENYIAEERFSKIIFYFSLLSLFIGCLGLYGLIAYTASQKIKEIGIRKVLGASANGIAMMLSFDFLKLVFIACLIAIPLSGYIMNNWLQEFAYRTALSWWMFAMAVAIVTIVALATVSFQAIKAAMANPIKSLRTE